MPHKSVPQSDESVARERSTRVSPIVSKNVDVCFRACFCIRVRLFHILLIYVSFDRPYLILFFRHNKSLLLSLDGLRIFS